MRMRRRTARAVSDHRTEAALRHAAAGNAVRSFLQLHLLHLRHSARRERFISRSRDREKYAEGSAVKNEPPVYASAHLSPPFPVISTFFRSFSRLLSRPGARPGSARPTSFTAPPTPVLPSTARTIYSSRPSLFFSAGFFRPRFHGRIERPVVAQSLLRSRLPFLACAERGCCARIGCTRASLTSPRALSEYRCSDYSGRTR